MDKIIYGLNPVIEALNSENVTVDKIFILKSKRDKRIQNIINLAKKENARIRFYDKKFFNKFKDFNHQGVVAEVVDFKYSELEDISEKSFIVLLDGITDVQNFGNIIRTCEFFGVNGIIIPKDKSATVNSTVIKTSSGAVFNIPIVKVTNLNSIIEKFKNDNYTVIGTSSHGNNTFNDMKIMDKVLLIIGNEEKGIRKSVLEKCDYVINIKGIGKTESLNVVSATSILVYEIFKKLSIKNWLFLENYLYNFMVYPRVILSKIKKYLCRNEVIILLGSRQTGKTTILNLLKNDLKDEKILYLDLDIETNLEYFSSYENIISYIKYQGLDPYNHKIFLLLDEFQQVRDSGKILKNLYDHHKNIKVIATGSSSLNIVKSLGDSMAGRKFIFNVYSLSFYEFLIFKENEKLINFYENFKLGDYCPDFIIKEFYQYFTEFLIYGSYPSIVNENSLEVKLMKINDILNSYFQKDIKNTLNIFDTINFKKVLEIVALYIGQLLNINSITKNLKLKYHIVNKFIEAAIETFFIFTIKPFSVNKKKEITKSPKVYYGDTGMRNFLVKNMNTDLKLRQDIGQLLENFVFNELIKNKTVMCEIKFWRTINKTEIDFLLIDGNNILPVEVKSGTMNKVPKGLRIFCKDNNFKKAIIFNFDNSSCVKEEGIEYYFVPYIFAGKIFKNEFI